MSVVSSLKKLVVASALAAPSVVFAGSTDIASSSSLTLNNIPQQPSASVDRAADMPAPDAAAEQQPAYLAEAAAPQPNIHGFAEVPFKTAYVTPRGLVVENQGLVIQPVAGLVFPIGDIGPINGFTFVTGVWNSINTNQHDASVGPWNELDYFASLSGNVGKFGGTLTYSPWNSPPHNFKTEHTSDFKLTYDDTGLIMPDFALKPYVDFFYSITGDSTVILGRKGSTYYFEFGIAPSYTFKQVHDYPVTFTFPTYISVGPENFWGRNDSPLTKPDGNLGVFSIAANVSVPLAFIPVKYGFWHADAGLQYFYLINDALLRAGQLASGNDNHNVLNASLGFGVNF